MTDLVVRAGVVITVDDRRRVIRDGAVAVDGGLIVEVGDGDALTRRHKGAELISAPGGVVLPGLIDAHSHAGHSLVRTLGGDDLGAWMAACEQIYLHGSTPGFWFAAARLAGLERLLAGTTTGVSMLGGAGDTIRCDDAAYAHAHVSGIREIGVRDVVVIGPGAPPFPKSTTDVDRSLSVESSFEDQMAVLRAVWDADHDGVRQFVAATFPTFTLDDIENSVGAMLPDAATTVAEFVRERDMLFVQDGHNGDTVVATDRLGLLSGRSLLSHSIDLGDREIELLAARGAAVAHNPSAIYSQFGRCPVPELLDAGVTVALGSDATAPDRSSDMFRHMFQATRYHRAVRKDPALLPPGRVVEMATIDAATALGLGDRAGSLEPGKWADLVVVDAVRPHLTPLTHPVHQIVYYATGADVATVVVGGEVLVAEGVANSVDTAAILEDGVRQQAEVIERCSLEGLLADRPGTWGSTRYPDGPGLTI